jgi:hypothetical protein
MFSIFRLQKGERKHSHGSTTDSAAAHGAASSHPRRSTISRNHRSSTSNPPMSENGSAMQSLRSIDERALLTPQSPGPIQPRPRQRLPGHPDRRLPTSTTLMHPQHNSYPGVPQLLPPGPGTSRVQHDQHLTPNTFSTQATSRLPSTSTPKIHSPIHILSAMKPSSSNTNGQRYSTIGVPNSGQCTHKVLTHCSLSSITECCACADKRPLNSVYMVYIDGVGNVPEGQRWSTYCWQCRSKCLFHYPFGYFGKLSSSSS